MSLSPRECLDLGKRARGVRVSVRDEIEWTVLEKR